MKIYTVHLRPGALTPDRDATVIKEGFCWPAFLFGPLWALYHRMWFAALGLLAVFLIVGFGGAWLGPDPLTDTAIRLGIMAVVGFCANDWRRTSLAARGWRMSGLSAAADGDAALRRYFDFHPEDAGAPAGVA